MVPATDLREDINGWELRRSAKVTKDAAHSRGLITLAEINDGGARSDAARIGSVGLQTIWDWVLRFNVGGPQGMDEFCCAAYSRD